MKRKKTNNLIIENILILIPFILYGIYKNGYLIYLKNLINWYMIFKPLYVILIAVIIKIIYDLIKNKKISLDYNFLEIILIAMIMPYNLNLLVFTITLAITYGILLYLEKYFKINKVCIIYLVIILINSLFNKLTFLNILETKYLYSFTFWDYLMGRNIGGMCSTSIFFSLLFYIYLARSIYYKKNIPLAINITYLILTFIYFLVTNNNEFLLNSEVIFASIFISSLPIYTPYSEKKQTIFGILIGIFTSIIAITFNKVLSIYISILIVNILMLILNKLSKKSLKLAKNS